MSASISSTPTETDLAAKIIEKQRVFFESHATRSLKFRKEQLKKLKKAILDHESQFYEALRKDLHKNEFETYGSEIAQVVGEIDFARKRLNKWARVKRVSPALVSFPSRHTVHPQPYGVCYVISAWNYPILLSLSPVVGAIAAGNCVVLKPSELAPHTGRLLCDMLSTAFDDNFLAGIFGGPEVSNRILAGKPDYVFFTGSPRVGKLIMKTAAEHLIPVTLELGGKSPCIVDEDADLKISARRIVFGKLICGGQTCVAPDFLLVHHNVKDRLLEHMKEFIIERYGRSPSENKEMCRIVNREHFDRLKNYLGTGTIYHGGNTQKESLYIEPTLLTDVTWDDAIMKEEIFGPILPVLTFTDFEKTIGLLNKKEKPLAAYYFGTSKTRQRYFAGKLNFGGGVINDTIFHFGNPRLPVGGIGTSGMGRYHGKYSFDTFSHLKSIVKKPYFADLELRYPPYNARKFKWLKRIFKL